MDYEKIVQLVTEEVKKVLASQEASTPKTFFVLESAEDMFLKSMLEGATIINGNRLEEGLDKDYIVIPKKAFAQIVGSKSECEGEVANGLSKNGICLRNLKLICEKDILRLAGKGAAIIEITKSAIITPSALDLLKKNGISIRRDD